MNETKISNKIQYEVIPGKNKNYPYRVSINGNLTHWSCKTNEDAENLIQDLRKDFNDPRKYSQYIVDEITYVLNEKFIYEYDLDGYLFYFCIDKDSNIKLHIHEINDESKCEGSLLIEDINNIDINEIINFGIPNEFIKTMAGIISKYTGETKVSYDGKEIYNFKDGEK